MGALLNMPPPGSVSVQHVAHVPEPGESDQGAAYQRRGDPCYGGSGVLRMLAPDAGPQLARMKSLKVWLPGETKPEEYSEGAIQAVGLQGSTAFAQVVTDDGQVAQYFNLPMKLIKSAPTGLVAASGGLVGLPNS